MEDQDLHPTVGSVQAGPHFGSYSIDKKLSYKRLASEESSVLSIFHYRIHKKLVYFLFRVIKNQYRPSRVYCYHILENECSNSV